MSVTVLPVLVENGSGSPWLPGETGLSGWSGRSCCHGNAFDIKTAQSGLEGRRGAGMKTVDNENEKTKWHANCYIGFHFKLKHEQS